MSIRTGHFTMPPEYIQGIQNYLDSLSVEIHRTTQAPQPVCGLTAIELLRKLFDVMEDQIRKDMKVQSIQAEIDIDTREEDEPSNRT